MSTFMLQSIKFGKCKVAINLERLKNIKKDLSLYLKKYIYTIVI